MSLVDQGEGSIDTTRAINGGKGFINHVFNFKQEGDLLYVNSKGNFKIDKLGVVLMDYKTESEEVYKNDQLIKYPLLYFL